MQEDRGGLRVRLLGPVGATVDGFEADIAGPKERAVLALLAANATATTSADQLIDALWGERPPKSAKKTIQTYISRLRRSLGASELGDVIVTGPGGYALSSAVTTDVAEVEALMASALRPHGGIDSGARVDVLADALTRFTGRPMSATSPSVALDALAESYEQLRWNLIEELADARLAAGGDPRLPVDLHAWVDENPYRERLWGHLMVALYRAGRQAEALAAFQRARAHLAEGLGIEPGPQLRELESRILVQDPTLDAPASAGAKVGSTSETLTFLFTDIEQSTVRWDLEPESMREALARHDQVLTSVIDAAGGRVFAAAGDGFGAAFSSPSAAAEAAVAAQDQLRDVEWPTTEPLRVRMGLHTGTAENRGGDFFGAPVNRAARIMDSAHGGQIVCSAATAALLGDDPTLGERIRFLAECRLKGLERPERLHQLSPPGADDEFPPPGSSLAPSRVLPAPLDSLHGRDAELAELEDLLGGQRLLTLTGVGGTGKTRLALELARRIGEAYRDGVIWLELAAVDVDGVVGAAARAIGVALTGDGSDHRAQVAAALREEEALLVLDNCEHLLGVAATDVEAILQTCPGVTVLTTSREPLGVNGERVYVVPSLGLPGPTGVSASEDLLRDRATSAGAVIADDPATEEAIRQLCVRVDGVPLALEFAAAQLTTFPAPELVAHLEEHFRLLGRPGRSGVPRQQTIDSTIEWSYRLLDPTERRMLDRLAIFHGGFGLDAVEPVAGFDLPPGESHLVLERLRWKSMITVRPRPGGTGTRFTLLEPVRQFAHARLRLGDEHAETLERHADFYAVLGARPAHGDRFAGDAERSVLLLQDRANVQVALDTLSRRDDPTAALQLFDACRVAFTIAWDFALEAQRVITPLLPRAEVLVDPVVIGHACNTLALVEGFDFRPTALDWAGRALDIATETGDETLLAEAEFHIGAIWVSVGEGAEAESHLRRSCELHDRLGNAGTLSYNVCFLAWALALQHRLDEAVEPARRGVELAWAHAAQPDNSVAVSAAIIAAAGHHGEAESILERLDALPVPPVSAMGVVAALDIGRLDIAARHARSYLNGPLGVGARDTVFVAAAAELCVRLDENDLGAVWTAVRVADERHPLSPQVDRAGAAPSTLRRRLGPLLEIDARIEDARTRMGDRFEELVRHYGTSHDPGPVRETLTVLDGHIARLTSPTDRPT